MKYLVIKTRVDGSHAIEFFDTLEGAEMYAKQFRGNKFILGVTVYKAMD